jgi:hypothetical protein
MWNWMQTAAALRCKFVQGMRISFQKQFLLPGRHAIIVVNNFHFLLETIKYKKKSAENPFYPITTYLTLLYTRQCDVKAATTTFFSFRAPKSPLVCIRSQLSALFKFDKTQRAQTGGSVIAMIEKTTGITITTISSTTLKETIYLDWLRHVLRLTAAGLKFTFLTLHKSLVTNLI